MKLNCVVVDDSSLQRMVIAKLVNNHPNLHLVGDFSNAIEAKNCMTVHTVDLIDVYKRQMLCLAFFSNQF